MSLSRPSEAHLAAAIDALKASPGRFQRLVEGYARLRDPSRYRDLAVVGRNPDDATVRGWPDAEVRRPDGLIDAVEMTHSPTWERHLAEDLQKLAASEVSSFLFVAWADAPNQVKESEWRKRIAAKGVPRGAIRLIFRRQLVTELSSPRFARLWLDPLGLTVSALPFRLFEDMHELFGQEDLTDAFRPSRTEHLEGRVYRPAVASAVLERLRDFGWALVRGHGASGKTVLATSLALSNDQQGPAYYLDLSEWEPTAERPAAETFVACADAGVLFVVDNVHLEPTAARRLFGHWKSSRNQSALLLLGRMVTDRPSAGSAPSLFDLEEKRLELSVGAPDIMGVYHRLLRRVTASDVAHRPPMDVVERWLRTFGGELVAFSVAVAARIRNLERGEWDLQPQHARGYIEEHYLTDIALAELTSLRKLVVLGELEIPATARALGGLPNQSLQSGLVVAIGRKERADGFRFVHPGMADLLRAAFGDVDDKRLIADLSALDSSVGVALAIRLCALERNDEARDALRAIAASETWFSSAFTVGSLLVTSSVFERLNVLRPREVERLVMNEPRFLSSTLTMPLQDLASFLANSGSTFPEAHQEVTRFVNRSEIGKELALRALAPPTNGLGSLLGYSAKRRILPVMRRLVADELEKPRQAQLIASQLLDWSLGGVSPFLRYLETNALQVAYTTIQAVVSEPDNARRLAERSLEEPLHNVAVLMDYMKTKLPVTHSAFVSFLRRTETGRDLCLRVLDGTALQDIIIFVNCLEDHDLTEVAATITSFLNQPGVARQLAGRCLGEPVGSVGAFLDFVEDHELSVVHSEFTSFLGRPDVVRHLARRLCSADLTELYNLTRSKAREIVEAAAAVIDITDWNRRELSKEPLDQLNLGAMALVVLGRPDLAAPLALEAIGEARYAEWRKGYRLRTLGYIAHPTFSADSARLERFLDEVCSYRWLRNQMRRASVGSLAGSMFALWGSLPTEQLRRFEKPLRMELEEPNKCRTGDDSATAALLSLIGTASLFGIRPQKDVGRRCSSMSLDTIVQKRHSAVVEQITALEVQLWLGLRAVASNCRAEGRVAASLGEAALERWRRSEPKSEKHQALNLVMIEWLERCAASGWKLLADPTPAPQ